MAYHPKTGDMEVLMEGLAFANGVQLSPEGDHVLVAETNMFRIIKYGGFKVVKMQTKGALTLSILRF